MASNNVAFTAIGIACIAAAGAGSYFALRQNATPAASPANAVVATAPAPADVPSATAEQPVRETEAVVAPPLKSTKAASSKPASSKPEKTEAASAPALNRTWPSSAAQTAFPQPVTPEPAPSQARTETPERAPEPPQPVVPPAPPQKAFEELVVSADSVIGLQSDTTVSSERARPEDRVEARVTRDVKVGDRVAIPAGARAIGYVTQVDRGGKFKEQARLAIRFQTIVLADGTRLPISTAPVERTGEGKGNSTAAKMGGGAVAGTILGAILGGGKGAAIGGMAGAGAGAAAVEAGDRSTAMLRQGEPITVRLLSPVTVTTER
jgi:type IV secretory pathway VirB10-like protein